MAELLIGAAIGLAAGYALARKFPDLLGGSKSGKAGGGGGAQPK